MGVCVCVCVVCVESELIRQMQAGATNRMRRRRERGERGVCERRREGEAAEEGSGSITSWTRDRWVCRGWTTSGGRCVSACVCVCVCVLVFVFGSASLYILPLQPKNQRDD